MPSPVPHAGRQEFDVEVIDTWNMTITPGRPPQRRIHDRHAVKTVYGGATGESEIKMWERNLEIRFCI